MATDTARDISAGAALQGQPGLIKMAGDINSGERVCMKMASGQRQWEERQRIAQLSTSQELGDAERSKIQARRAEAALRRRAAENQSRQRQEGQGELLAALVRRRAGCEAEAAAPEVASSAAKDGSGKIAAAQPEDATPDVAEAVRDDDAEQRCKAEAAAAVSGEPEQRCEAEAAAKMAQVVASISTPLRAASGGLDRALSRGSVAEALENDPGWLAKPFWAHAVACAEPSDGCLAMAIGQWVWVQYVGTGANKRWSYGTDESGALSGWFLTDAVAEHVADEHGADTGGAASVFADDHATGAPEHTAHVSMAQAAVTREPSPPPEAQEEEQEEEQEERMPQIAWEASPAASFASISSASSPGLRQSPPVTAQRSPAAPPSSASATMACSTPPPRRRAAEVDLTPPPRVRVAEVDVDEVVFGSCDSRGSGSVSAASSPPPSKKCFNLLCCLFGPPGPPVLRPPMPPVQQRSPARAGAEGLTPETMPRCQGSDDGVNELWPPPLLRCMHV
mmetsp:Transcript_39175/g.101315  ORF Transcript_39175/g.101315 Transcript_39175/m.101315 type:complete len:508 (+) Transcript_39175:134-1657(+)